MRLTRIEKEYQYQIINLKAYYKTRYKDKADRSGLESVKAYAWRFAIRKIEAETSGKMMRLIKHVYILEDMTMTKAADIFLHYSHSKACELVRQWFKQFDCYFFEGLKDVI